MINVKARRIIPCLDVCNGKVVKGINFIGFREIGDPVEYAIEYEKQERMKSYSWILRYE